MCRGQQSFVYLAVDAPATASDEFAMWNINCRQSDQIPAFQY